MHNADKINAADCHAAELLYADAFDSRLSPAEQQLLDLHLAQCPHCRQQFAEVLEGAGYLELLKQSRPTPRPELLDSILAHTCGADLQPEWNTAVPVGTTTRMGAAHYGWSARLMVLLEPRFMMTVATAFCSVALTLSLAGVHPDDLHTSDFSLAGVSLAAHEAETSLVHRYDNSRVVHVLESRVDSLRENLDSRPNRVASPAHKQSAPTQGGSQPAHVGKGSASSPSKPEPGVDRRGTSQLALLVPLRVPKYLILADTL